MDVNKAAGTHAWISFAYSAKKGPYMTVYLAPRIQEAWEAKEKLGSSVPDLRSNWAWHPAAKEKMKDKAYIFAR